MILVTGGAGFIGSNFINFVLENAEFGHENIVNLDKLTYAGNALNLAAHQSNSRYSFVHGDICNSSVISKILADYKPTAIVNFAAESHVDRSISNPGSFIQTNIFGVYTMLQCTREYWQGLDVQTQERFRFLHVSTDEVFGSLEVDEPPFSESTPFAPNSPYAASKAASDHLVRAWNHTYGLPVITTNCSNNYGPLQFPEKLIPLVILNAIKGKPLPVYGDGRQIRDWLYVEDHCRAIMSALNYGVPGETYNIGGCNEVENIVVVKSICHLLDELHPRTDSQSYEAQIAYVADRPGHDRRYAINAAKTSRAFGWCPNETFESGLRKTVVWYLENTEWVNNVLNGEYLEWAKFHYGELV